MKFEQTQQCIILSLAKNSLCVQEGALHYLPIVIIQHSVSAECSVQLGTGSSDLQHKHLAENLFPETPCHFTSL